MVETSVLAELMFDIVPNWCEKLEKYIQEAEDAKKPTSGIIITPSGVGTGEINTPKILTSRIDAAAAASGDSLATTDKDKAPESNIPQLKKSLAGPHGACRLDAKPSGTKTRFSCLTSPVVMYDGQSQHVLSELWTSLNNKRGGLRREMMTLKRRQELSEPKLALEIESETDGASTAKDEEDDLEHSSEMLRLRLKMEREKMKRMNRRAGGVGGAPVGITPLGALPFKRARTMAPPLSSVSTPQAVTSVQSEIDDQKLKALLEDIDDNLDKACKLTETVAFVWLKGDAYEGHLKFIVGRLKDTAVKIEASGFVPAKKNAEGATAAGTVPPAADSQIMPPPLPPTPLRPELSRKKSDSTMRDACAVSLVSASPVKSDQPEQLQTTIPAAIEVGSIKDEITSDILANMLATGKAPEESCKPSQPRANSLDPDVIEVEDDDDEGIVC